MSKVVHINGERIGVSDKEWNIVDSNNNVKKFAELYKNFNEKILDVADDPISTMEFLVNQIPGLLESMLDLNKTDRKKLDESSFSDQYEIFREMSRKFLGLELTSMNEEEEQEDPKSQEEE
ncbi:hypothetical protein [Ligilactobacillus equi]